MPGPSAAATESKALGEAYLGGVLLLFPTSPPLNIIIHNNLDAGHFF